MIKKIITLLFLGLIVFACKVDPKIITPLPSNDVVEVIPDGWPQPVYSFSSNPVNENTFILGRYLFYETLLSKDNSISCGSCHQQFTAFANADHKFSHGVNQQLGKRNAPGLFNLTWHTSFMHDGGINHIEVQPLGPITNPIEMAEEINNVLSKLRATEKYRNLFKAAFGTDSISSQRMLKALTQFQGLIYSYDSKYDNYKNNKTTYSDAESNGYVLFKAKCAACHTEPLFSDFQFRNNGLTVDPVLKDSGRAHIDRLPESLYKFKTPSLRNVAKTFPYMHDGRFITLEQCLDHYTDGVKNLVNLDPLLLNNGIPMTAKEKQDIISFLNTLTDYKFINDKRFADPNFQ